MILYITSEIVGEVSEESLVTSEMYVTKLWNRDKLLQALEIKRSMVAPGLQTQQ